MLLSDYDPENGPFFDETFGRRGEPRPPCAELIASISALGQDGLRRHQLAAEEALMKAGITFTLQDDDGGSQERILPFDIIPRIIDAREWQSIEQGLKQRVRALNAFLQDLYHRQEIIRSGRLPIHFLRALN